ncbi:MAG: Chitinase, partial [uncultured Sulfurovum sp.]
MRKMFLKLSIILVLGLMGCKSSDEGKELLTQLLQVVGIPYNMVVNICQDNNSNGICNIGEVKATLKIEQGDTSEDIWEKFLLSTNGQYILENYDPTKDILMEINDDGLFSSEKNVTIPYPPKILNEEESQELSILQALKDKNFLTNIEHQEIVDNPKVRTVVDNILLENIFYNQTVLEEVNLTATNATLKNLEYMADGLQELNVTQLIENLNNCEQNQTEDCKEVIIRADDSTEINQEDALIIKETNSTENTSHNGVKDDNNKTISISDNGNITITNEERNTTSIDNNNSTSSVEEPSTSTLTEKTEKNAADGYIIKLATVATATCYKNDFTTVIGTYSSEIAVGVKGLLTFNDVALNEFCSISVPAGATIDSNNNGLLDDNDTIMSFEMKSFGNYGYISPLTTLAYEKKAKGEDISAIASMIKDFNPVTGASFIANATGVEKVKLQKLLILAEVLKTSLKDQKDIVAIDLSNVINTDASENIGDFQLNELISNIIISPAPEALFSTFIRDREEIMKELVNLIEFLEPDKIDLDMFLVNISDGGTNIEGAINASLKVPATGNIFEFPIKSDANIASVTSTLSSINDRINVLPIANAGADQTITQGDSIILDGSNSSDYDGSIRSYTWKEDDVVLSTNVSFTKSNFSRGTHTITLIVTDDDNATSSDDVQIKVEGILVNQAPIANAGIDQTVDAGTAVSFSGSGSDSDGTIASYRWTASDGTELSTLQNFSKSDLSVGTHTITLTVTDDGGLSGRDDIIITIQTPPPVNQSPIANAGIDQTVDAGTAVSFSGSGSDSDGTIASYRWTASDGTELSTLQNFSKSDLSVGTHTI